VPGVWFIRHAVRVALAGATTRIGLEPMLVERGRKPVRRADAEIRPQWEAAFGLY
jgi:hypothetical protein